MILSTAVQANVLQKLAICVTGYLPVCELTVSLLASILRVGFCQFFGDDQLRNVDLIAQ